MSAIWGAIDLQGKAISDNVKMTLKEGFQDCKLDRIEELSKDNVYMGCGIQYFTPEAIEEVLPVEKDGIIFNADVILDNRKELCNQLGIEEHKKVSDGWLLQEYYRKYGWDGLNTLLGAYVFVNYQKEKNLIEVVSDAVGYRFIYYFFQDGIFFYASLMTPLEKLIHPLRMNRRWIGDYIAQDNLNIFTECEETPTDGIYRIAPAHKITVSEKNIEKKQYWDPNWKVKKINYQSDKLYKEHFLKLYEECVTCLLRSNGETAVLLSGGYDSTSLTCFAAPELERRGKKLYAFTSVPMKDYKSEFGKECMTDETEAVKKTSEYFPNLDCTFMDLPDMNGWYDYSSYCKIAEIPYKSPQNMLWMYEGLKLANQKNARIMLIGAFGNGTVSFNNCMVYLPWLLQHGHLLTLYREITAIHKKRFYTRKSVLKTTIKDALGLKREKNLKEEIYQNSFAKIDYIEQSGSLERIWNLYNNMPSGYSDYIKFRNSFITLDILRHYGEFAQKNSLYTGTIFRDPTRDRRMIEFTRAIPYNQFTKEGVFRRLISEYMEERMPKHILEEKRTGRQSADLKMRILRDENKIRKEWITILEENVNSEVIDCKKALKILQTKKISDMTDFEIVRYIYSIKLLEYMKKYTGIDGLSG